MAQGQKIYDPVTKTVVTLDDAQQIMQERGASGGGDLTIRNPLSNDQQVGFDLPPVAGEDASAMLQAFPQIAGILAQFTPPGRSMAGAVGIPAVIDMIIQAVTKGVGEVDPMQTAVQGAFGGMGRTGGNAMRWLGDAGEEKILKALNLTGDFVNDTSIKVLPKLAIREGAQLTEPGVKKVADKAARTGLGGLEELADAMGQARRRDLVAPARTTFWPNEMAANWLRKAPRQMAMGQRMVAPIPGVGSREVLAPTTEASIKALMALVAGQIGAGDEEPPLETSRGPRRRGGAQ